MNYKNNLKYSLKIILDIYFFSLLSLFLYRLFIATLWDDTFAFFVRFTEKMKFFYEKYMISLCLICAILKIITVKCNVWKKGFLMLFALAGFISYNNSGEYYIITIILLIIAALGTSAKKILIFTAVINMSLMSITVISSQIGKLENFVEIGRNREFLGFSWTTTSVMIFCYSIFSILIIKKYRLNLFDFLILNSINLWFFIKTDTRFVFLIFLLTTFFIMIKNSFVIQLMNLEVVKKLLILFVWICFLFSFVTSYYYNEDIFYLNKLNSLLSQRLMYCNHAFQQYGIKLLGQKTVWEDQNLKYYVDSAYLQFMIKYGLIVVLLFLVLLSTLIKILYDNKLYTPIIILCFLFLFAITEQQLLWLEYNSLLFLFSADLSSIRKENKNRLIYKNNTIYV